MLCTECLRMQAEAECTARRHQEIVALLKAMLQAEKEKSAELASQAQFWKEQHFIVLAKYEDCIGFGDGMDLEMERA